MSVTPTTTKTGTRRRFMNHFKSKVVLFYRQQKELREISSAQKDGSGNHASNNQPINEKRSEQVFGSMSFIWRITGIDRHLISYWIEHGDEILKSKSKLTTFKLKTNKSNSKREAGASIAGFQIKVKAVEIYNEIHPIDFETDNIDVSTPPENSSATTCSLPLVDLKASDGWLSNFCQRRGFVLRRVSSCGRELPQHCLSIIFAFYRDLTKVIEDNGFEAGQILNMDESCQYVDAPSHYTYSLKGVKRTVVNITGAEKKKTFRSMDWSS
ncbi:RNA-binding 45-like [Brachionus plicatilis]|uniref:RNA-binding 45-like n=1 Tax=Brachionus plicatilis TaxID=10195 RepID=A0A3M7Q5N8_BRAPC|nr:RNA-binding 45-like [Brachionus plicatilis]